MSYCAVRFMDWMHRFSVHLKYKGSIIRYILWQRRTLPARRGKAAKHLIGSELTIVTLDDCESGTHVIA